VTYTAKNFESLLGSPGFSEPLLRNHFALYQGYVANTNTLAEMLGALIEAGRTATPEYAELKRRFGWEWNGMRLHELYFGNLTRRPEPLREETPLARKLSQEFGSLARWEQDFRSTGSMRGVGWVLLVHERSGGRLFNTWIDEHDAGHLAGAEPLLVMDVFEHAFMLDYGLKRADYIESFFRAIHWAEVAARF